MNSAEKIIQKIKDENIRPKPRWQFFLSELIKKSLFLLFIISGSISFSVILFAISQSEFSLLHHLRHSEAEFILVMMPVIWLCFLIVFLGASVFSVLTTGRSYKLTYSRWIGYSTALCISLGVLFFITGGAQWFEKKFETHVESYESIADKKLKIWSQPNLGTLSGEIVSLEDNSLVIKDWNGKIWQVDITDTFIAPMVDLEPGTKIKISGRKVSDDEFSSDKIRPGGGIPGQAN
jgi:hypothetical protein